jgi:fructose-1,6-bisphosphatase
VFKYFPKQHEVDLVTEADLKSEEILINAITKHFPNDGIISEESETINSDAERIWIIDPLRWHCKLCKQYSTGSYYLDALRRKSTYPGICFRYL